MVRSCWKVSAARITLSALDNCITRLRFEIKDYTKVDEKKIKSAGVAGVIRPNKNNVQVIVGTKGSVCSRRNPEDAVKHFYSTGIIVYILIEGKALHSIDTGN